MGSAGFDVLFPVLVKFSGGFLSIPQRPETYLKQNQTFPNISKLSTLGFAQIPFVAELLPDVHFLFSRPFHIHVSVLSPDVGFFLVLWLS